jgi:hypothetical protein
VLAKPAWKELNLNLPRVFVRRAAPQPSRKDIGASREPSRTRRWLLAQGSFALALQLIANKSLHRFHQSK